MTKRVLPAGVLTFLFTDMEGSTRLHHRLGDRFQTLIGEHDRLLRRAITRHGGVVVKGMGDGLFAVFADASAAATAAIAAQQLLRHHSWTDDADVRVRMGLHTGVAAPRGGDYSALAVAQAARVCDAAHGGQVLLTSASAKAATALPADLALQELGSYRLKDFDEPAELYQLCGPGLPADFPALRAPSAIVHNVPTLLTAFVGRERELEQLAAVLRAHRLVTLVGVGGVGKTRLAFEAVSRCASRYDGGAWVALLAGLNAAEPPGVAAAVAAAVGVAEQADRPVLESLVDQLAPRRLLLVLDNCEHVLPEAAALVERLLTGCPGVTILTTSRETLRLPGEHVWRLAPLTVPLETDGDPGVLIKHDAVRLFVERARQVRPDFRLDATTAPAVTDVCRQLEGIPLAIELAAARLRHLSAGQLSARLADRFRLLTGGHRAALPRHQTLRATVDWSHDLLTAEERVLFRSLSVFNSPFTLEAAEGVCADETNAPDDILDLLAALYDKSLLLVADSATGVGYRMLVTIRDYAREQLEAAGEVERVRARHCSYFADAVAMVPYRAMEEMPDPASLSRLWLMEPDLRAAMDWSIRAQHADVTLALAARLTRWAYRSGRWRDGLSWARRALEVDGGSPEPRCWVNYRASTLAVVTQDVDAAAAYGHDMLDVAMSAGLGHVVPFARHVLADAAAHDGNVEEARREWQAALDHECTTAAHAAVLRCSLAELALQTGDDEVFESVHRDALETFRELGDHFEIARVVARLGFFLADTRPEEAASLLHEAMAAAEEIDSSALRVYALAAFAVLAGHEDRPAAVALLAGTTRRLAEQNGAALVESGDVSGLPRAYDAQVAEAQRRLGEEDFARAQSHGRALSPADAVAAAYPGLDTTPSH